MANNKFTFHNVGQGLFYSGSIDDGKFNFIYDCGSMLRNGNINSCIDSIPNEIDFLVISHFHNDHISGLPRLFSKKTIKKVFLPYFDTKTYKDIFIATLLGNGILPNNNGCFELITKLYGCEIDLPSKTNKDQTTKEIEIIKCDKCENFNKWSFLFVNKKIDDAIVQQLNVELKRILNDKSIEDYLRECQDNYKNVATVFKNKFKNINLSSLLLLHFGDNNANKKTLLTGDVMFDDDLSKRIINKIGENDELTFQVPHHGATEEWDNVPNEIIKKANNVVLSFGLSNGYHHPCNKIICKYYSENNMDRLKLVFENKKFDYEI